MPIIKNKIFTKSKKTTNFLIILLFLTSFFLVFVNKADLYIGSKIKTTSIEIISPLSYFVSYPLLKTSEAFENLKELRAMSVENDILKEEIKRLKQWHILSLKLINENNAYKQLLNVTDENFTLQRTGRVISKSPNFFANTVQLNLGEGTDIKINSTVINERGLVGRIVDVGKLSSRVLLITDINSSIPVKTLNQDIQAIVSGQSNSFLLKLKFIKENQIPKIGEILITSGNAGMFPPNIAVGKIYKIENKTVYAKSFVNFNNLEFVNVVTNKN